MRALLIFYFISNNRSLFEFLESSLRNKAEMVIYEAARAIISLRNLTAKELASAINVLQILCSSSKAPLRYAAVRTLNTVATNYPSAVLVCNLNLEQMISDYNRSISTLAITTLLKVYLLFLCMCVVFGMLIVFFKLYFIESSLKY